MCEILAGYMVVEDTCGWLIGLF